MSRQFPLTSKESRAYKSEFGLDGFKRLASTDNDPLNGEFYAIVAINGDATLAAGIEVDVGDAPADGDVLLQEIPRYAPFTTITPPTSGVLLCYYYPSP